MRLEGHRRVIRGREPLLLHATQAGGHRGHPPVEDRACRRERRPRGLGIRGGHCVAICEGIRREPIDRFYPRVDLGLNARLGLDPRTVEPLPGCGCGCFDSLGCLLFSGVQLHVNTQDEGVHLGAKGRNERFQLLHDLRLDAWKGGGRAAAGLLYPAEEVAHPVPQPTTGLVRALRHLSERLLGDGRDVRSGIVPDLGRGAPLLRGALPRRAPRTRLRLLPGRPLSIVPRRGDPLLGLRADLSDALGVACASSFDPGLGLPGGLLDLGRSLDPGVRHPRHRRLDRAREGRLGLLRLRRHAVPCAREDGRYRRGHSGCSLGDTILGGRECRRYRRDGLRPALLEGRLAALHPAREDVPRTAIGGGICHRPTGAVGPGGFNRRERRRRLGDEFRLQRGRQACTVRGGLRSGDRSRSSCGSGGASVGRRFLWSTGRGGLGSSCGSGGASVGPARGCSRWRPRTLAPLLRIGDGRTRHGCRFSASTRLQCVRSGGAGCAGGAASLPVGG